MTDIEILRANAAAAKAELMAAEQAEQAARRAAAELIPRVWEWRIEWKSEYVFRCNRRYTPETTAALKAVGGELYRNEDWHGMEYVLVGNMLVRGGGGTLVLKGTDARDTFSHEPRKLSDEEAAALRAGTVPAGLMA